MKSCIIVTVWNNDSFIPGDETVEGMFSTVRMAKCYIYKMLLDQFRYDPTAKWKLEVDKTINGKIYYGAYSKWDRDYSAYGYCIEKVKLIV